MEFETAYEAIKDVPGWMGIEDCRVIYEYASGLEGLIVEIGSYLGRTTKFLSLIAPQSKIITIDSFKMGCERCFGRTVADCSNVELIKSRSQDVYWTRPIDFLLVDGGHSYTQVKKDINKYLPFVKGVALFHDYTGYLDNQVAYGVKLAVNEIKHPIEKEGGFAVYKK